MSIEDLEAWQIGMNLVDATYGLTSSFPGDERYVLVSQMRRAAISIPSNLAEGHARHSRRDYARFVSHAQGSAAELWTQLRIARRRGYVADAGALTELLDHVSRKTNNLRRSLLTRPRIPNPESRIPND